MTNYDRCLDRMKMFMGIYPYEGYNPCKGDGYFYEDMKKNYPKDMIEKVHKECLGFEERWNEFKKNYDK